MPRVGLRRCCRIAKSACLRMYPRGTLEDAQKPKLVGMTWFSCRMGGRHTCADSDLPLLEPLLYPAGKVKGVPGCRPARKVPIAPPTAGTSGADHLLQRPTACRLRQGTVALRQRLLGVPSGSITTPTVLILPSDAAHRTLSASPTFIQDKRRDPVQGPCGGGRFRPFRHALCYAPTRLGGRPELRRERRRR
jgi:hypothetical protein